ncbi:hypothetical protein EOA13_12015 [Mesorhizobium sp. M7A.F.Ca.US.011.01.1.1]|uniref:hypothetical protein n=1 Tax=Mesorhizobium sp. M7A.F.Ca.US.011.01.1.1 TaxID=2496741 RepID=UPI000FCAAE67|nr:hypothetical protein [Mesorhizobium sp. M7A.F.Ca.US.011.01.1.1]RUX29766.1 hypothetical protein EOA13_12015 [Mesorhizobium sp. M7A.F.Ca.US.011.01.1.1]
MTENTSASVRKLFSPRWLEAAGIVLTLIALVWWAIVYAQVMSNTGFPIERTLPCLLQTSDRCSLAMSLCKTWHFLGIRRYSPELFWAGAIISSFALLWGSFMQDPKQKKEGT